MRVAKKAPRTAVFSQKITGRHNRKEIEVKKYNFGINLIINETDTHQN